MLVVAENSQTLRLPKTDTFALLFKRIFLSAGGIRLWLLRSCPWLSFVPKRMAFSTFKCLSLCCNKLVFINFLKLTFMGFISLLLYLSYGCEMSDLLLSLISFRSPWLVPPDILLPIILFSWISILSVFSVLACSHIFSYHSSIFSIISCLFTLI